MSSAANCSSSRAYRTGSSAASSASACAGARRTSTADCSPPRRARGALAPGRRGAPERGREERRGGGNGRRRPRCDPPGKLARVLLGARHRAVRRRAAAGGPRGRLLQLESLGLLQKRPRLVHHAGAAGCAALLAPPRALRALRREDEPLPPPAAPRTSEGRRGGLGRGRALRRRARRRCLQRCLGNRWGVLILRRGSSRFWCNRCCCFRSGSPRGRRGRALLPATGGLDGRLTRGGRAPCKVSLLGFPELEARREGAISRGNIALAGRQRCSAP